MSGWWGVNWKTKSSPDLGGDLPETALCELYMGVVGEGTAMLV